MTIYNSSAFLNFLADCREAGIFPRSMRYTKDGELRLAVDFPPYKGDEPMHVYSLSKSFTSVAVGVASDEGLLSLDELMSDIFPDRMPAVMNENLKEMRLKDLLSMQSGHSSCALCEMIRSRESLKTFFAYDTPYKPGTKFIYSTGGTLVCGASVTRRTGKALDDFISEKVFKKLGITNFKWDKTDDGLCQGGVGLYISADDLLKFGSMLLNEGTYEGQRIVSAEYIREASIPHSVDANNGSEDWVAGYGYQFWMNAKGGYRGDGAYGQLLIIFPETKEVFVMMCECGDMQREYHIIMKLISGLKDKDDSRLAEAISSVSGFYTVNRTKPLRKALKYSVGDNESRMFGIELVPDGEKLLLNIDCDYGRQTVVCGNGEYLRSSCRLMALSPAIVALHNYGTPEEFNVFASYEQTDSGVDITLLHSDLPHGEVWHIAGGKLVISPRYGGLKQTEFDLAPLA